MSERREDPRHDWLNRQLDLATEGLGIYGADQMVRSFEPTAVHRLRRTGGTRVDDNLGTVTLVEKDGVLRWVDGLGFRQRDQRRRRRQGPGQTGSIIKQLKYERLEQNAVGSAIAQLDLKLNANTGIRAWSSPTRARRATPRSDGRILLFVHGTFSKSEAITDGLNATDKGKAFFDKAKAHYDQIISFDHPTLSVSPVLNAIDLTRHLAGTDAEIDVICHSRGGLVVRWWVEALLANPDRLGKVIFVGSPLAGTSLAAPPRLRSGLDMLTNIAEVLGKGSQLASTVIPLFTAVAGILKIFGSAARVLSKTPLIDATVYMIPGLAAQSMTGDNSSILKLREGISRTTARAYYGVASDFEPISPGWAFWRYFQRPLQHLADAGADMVFEGSNDLVVDTHSMSELSDQLSIPNTRMMSSGPQDVIHHLNYFRQESVIEYFEKTLKLS